ncbi:MAG TPA: trypsin-like peptidase domain-containing protein [Acidimicrobiia bacterium]|nr:trypsin-like peptidase domain-containing protein [Acidimicrobiia bacterium]
MLDMDTVNSETKPDRRDDAPSRVLMLFAVLTVFAAGWGIGWLAGPAPVEETPVTTTSASPTTTTVPETETATDEVILPPDNTTPPADPVTGALVSGNSDEPVADVAQALLPSVVQIMLPSGGLGSGVIYDSNGRILTAAHVVTGVDAVLVRFANGDRVPGRVLGSDDANDIAVVEVDHTGLPAAPLALDDDPRPGQLAIALGSPWGLDSTVTSGIISAVDQAIQGPDRLLRLMLQTDASINPGNSGGPLADRYGRIVGINVSIYTASGANDGVGFAVPIERAYRVARALVEGGEFDPGFLGVTIDATATGRAGSVITSISPGSAAASGGLQVGDIVVAVDGDPIGDYTDLAAVIRNYAAGDTIELEVDRDGERLVLTAVLGSRPPEG